jgi:hypothetical protein
MSSQVHFLTSYHFYGTQWLKITQSKGSIRLGAAFPKIWKQSWLLQHCASLKNWTMDKSQKRRMCQLTSAMLCSPLLDFLTFEDGADSMS